MCERRFKHYRPTLQYFLYFSCEFDKARCKMSPKVIHIVHNGPCTPDVASTTAAVSTLPSAYQIICRAIETTTCPTAPEEMCGSDGTTYNTPYVHFTEPTRATGLFGFCLCVCGVFYGVLFCLFMVWVFAVVYLCGFLWVFCFCVSLCV